MVYILSLFIYLSLLKKKIGWVAYTAKAVANKLGCTSCYVDWSKLSKSAYTTTVNKNLYTLVDFMYRFLEKLDANGGALNETDCIGHSLGAHACGLIGKKCPSDKKLNRIYGM